MSNQLEGRQRIVAIDGPSGVGKSTVSRCLAAELGFTYLDTGAMYRAVAYGCERAGVDVEDEAAVAELLENMHIQLLPPVPGGDDVCVLLNGEDIGIFIRTPEMGMLASKVSAQQAVRAKLTAMQQDLGKNGSLVAEGRDIGTVVFPNASWKFYLDASPEERARRRVAQLQEKGQIVDEGELLAQIIKRDQDDRERKMAPLARAEDAVLVDSSSLNADGVVARMLEVVRQ